MTTHNFQLIYDTHISEINTRAQFYRHIKTGAQFLSLINDDENKVFGVTFRTPPSDSTGLPHILEHSVLNGSRKYPIKEPFVQLIKSSLNTYLNASTFPDKTAYPVASTNLKDFYNLVDVYLDAVFHPLIPPHVLEQEGWHYELDAVDAPLSFKGVVFNEMKGAYSSPDNVLWRVSKESLFPDTIYKNDSGGNPEAIPNLTYEQFKQFHETYYHPGNARIYFYGNDNPEERLRLLDQVLNEFEPQKIESGIALQPHIDEPRYLVQTYGVDSDGDNSHKTLLRMNWLLPEANDPMLAMGLSVLSYAIIGTQASPLRKALVDSGLSEDVSGGLASSTRQLTFTVGMKNIASADAGNVETLVLETLEKLAEEGIDPAMIEAAMNSIEFHLRENNTGSYPRGLALMFSALSSWIYDRDPLEGLRYEGPLNAIKFKLATDPSYLQRLIREHLLANQHRTTVILEPDPEHNQRLEEKERERLQNVRASLSDDDLEAIVAKTQELKRIQAEVDSPEALASLPSLTLADLDREEKTIPNEVSTLNDATLLYHDLFTNGIVYLNFGWNLQAVPQELLSYVRLFGMALTEMGTESEDYVKLSQRIMRKTGGVYFSTLNSSVRNDPAGAAWFLLSGKSTVAQVPELLDIMRDVLLTVKLDNPERFKQIVLKTKARNESGMIPSGHSVVDGRLRAGFSTSAFAGEQMSGLSWLFFLRQLQGQIDSDWSGVLANLEAVRSHLLNRNAMFANVTLDSENWQLIQPQVASFIDAIPSRKVKLHQWQLSASNGNEGLSIPAQVNYVGKGANLYELGYQYSGAINVINNFVRTGYLWDKIRVQGGAYGAFCKFRKQSGVYTFLSYRDPNLQNTLDVYDGAANFLRSAEIDQAELTRNIIGAMGDWDSYELPDAKGYTALSRYLLGVTHEELQNTREEILNTSVKDFRDFADVLAAVSEKGRVVVMGSGDALEKANGANGNKMVITKVM